jgi:glycosyltransferase involved in cell wall biosynthesis
MRTKVLVVSASLGLGGSEKCMAEMLKNMDTERFDITVLALNGVEAEVDLGMIDKVVNGLDDVKSVTTPTRELIRKPSFLLHPIFMVKKIIFSFISRNPKKHSSTGFWTLFASDISELNDYYDVAIGYGQGLASYYVIDKVKNAKRKILWLNTDLEKAKYDVEYLRRFYESADAIFADSENGVKNLVRLYPNCKKRVRCFYNMVDIESIKMAAKQEVELPFMVTHPILLTVGRIVEAKAMHFVADAAAELKARGYTFTWLIIGDGGERDKLVTRIKENNVEDSVILLGVKRNPYPWFDMCDIYVQTSIYEGSCMTITEAQVLGKVVVSTNFPAVYEKIENEKNGLITEMNGKSIAEAIERLFMDSEVLDEMRRNIQQKPVDYHQQMENLYKIFYEGA